MKVAGPSKAIVYFESKPSPMHTPTPNQALNRSARMARSKKYKAPAHAAVSGASGIINSPIAKKNGKAENSRTAMKAAVLP